MGGNGFALLLVFIGGMAVSIQAPINASLGQAAGNGVFAAAASFLIGAIALMAIFLMRGHYPQMMALRDAPWWVWTGGLLGAFYVWAALSGVQKIGALTLIAAVIAGQLVAAIAIDAMGFAGLSTREVSWQRIAAVILVMGGLFLSRY